MQQKLQTLANDETSLELTLPETVGDKTPALSTKVKKNTIKVVGLDGRDKFLMKTIVDSTGEVTATDFLSAAVVSARFRNLAERDGKIGIDFQIRVPGVFKEQKWQMRLTPIVFAGKDSVKLDRLVITGDTYREFEELGDRKLRELEHKIETSEGITRRNFEAMRGYYYNRFYMPKPESVRVDTLVRDDYEEFVYEYSCEYQTLPKSHKVEVVVDGEILAMNDYIYRMPRSEPLVFYISSLSAFVDDKEKYKTVVISQKLEVNKSYNIEFAQGKWLLDPKFKDNAQVVSEIEKHLELLLENKEYDLDSVVVTASASPEGGYPQNRELSGKRSVSIADYFNAFMQDKVNQLNRRYEESYAIDAGTDTVSLRNEKIKPISFISRSIPENWPLLEELIMADTVLTATEKNQYLECCETVPNIDTREWKIREFKWYKYVRSEYYPRLRAVRFDFKLHRKARLVEVIDTTYMDGIQAVKDRDYEKAVELLRPYNDYNTAVAYCASGRNHSALQILEKVPATPQTHYLKAILYARLDDEEKAVREYVESCRGDRTYISRGNLDPEISALIRRYNINLLDSGEDNFGW